jgi:hypothetical protein
MLFARFSRELRPLICHLRRRCCYAFRRRYAAYFAAAAASLADISFSRRRPAFAAISYSHIFDILRFFDTAS